MEKHINVLVAPNSFKECADSVEISTLMKAAFNKYIPDSLKPLIQFIHQPIADGGDGFLEVCKNAFGLETLHFEVPHAYDTEKFFVPAGYGVENKTLYIESADILGMKTIPEEFRKPVSLSSRGLGDLLMQVLDNVEMGLMQIEKVVIGIGGTGTNDLGMGMMEVFGLELYDKNDNQLEVVPANFNLVEKIAVPEGKLPFEIEMIYDVENPLLGLKGASKVFAKQKGATEEEVEELEMGFNNLLKQMEVNHKTISELSGAGGGLAAALKLFFNAKEKSATEFLEHDLGMNSEKINFDAAITGEGKYDFQSFMNKGAMIVANRFVEKEVPVYFVCGISEGDLPENDWLHVIEISEYFDSIEESIKYYDKGIDTACRKISKKLIQLISKKEIKN
jgi:glycerate 2-kinase